MRPIMPATPSTHRLTESPRSAAIAIRSEVVPAGEPWLGRIERGQAIRIVDIEGNQAVDTLFFNASDPRERYSATDTIRAQRSLYLTTGSRLLSNDGELLLTIVADTCGRHDTIGGACSAESNTVRYGHHTKAMHNCRDSFLLAAARSRIPLSKRDLTSNINFFMNVPVTPQGDLTFADGISAGGKYVELTAAMDVLCLISNCPQLNNPCNAFNPTPIRVLVWQGAPRV
jgi:urea carboxylase-associated protein 1